MAISVSDFIQSVRYPLNDFKDIVNPEYSDIELVSYLNRALTLLSLALANIEWRGLLKKGTLIIQNKTAQLPDDFIKEYYVKITGEDNELKYSDAGEDVEVGYYSIIGNTLHVNAEDNISLDIKYFYNYPTISIDDNLPCFDWMSPYLHNLVEFMALNRNEFALNIESSLVRNAAQRISGVTDTYGNRNFDDLKMAW